MSHPNNRQLTNCKLLHLQPQLRLSVIKYAEYIIHHKIDGMVDNFDAIRSRLYIAAQQFKHGCAKQIEEYETDFDLVPRSVRKDRKLKGVVVS